MQAFALDGNQGFGFYRNERRCRQYKNKVGFSGRLSPPADPKPRIGITKALWSG